MDKQQARMRMEGCLKALISQSGYLAGLDTVGDCMKDADLRAYLGHGLLDEIMPVIPLEKDQVSALAMEICGEMENPTLEESLTALCQNGARAWEKNVLPVMEDYLNREGAIPSCLSFSLACLIMYFSGARRNAEGTFEGLRAGAPYQAKEDEAVLTAFARLSPDMPPDSLAYAVLADRDIWERDLREMDGLAEKIEGQIRDLQILGLREAMKKTYE
ncbi:MAG: hypothetical protein E7324_10465 [Clostridiales bacterium]|nr:hypothetical protein [Clostridiales bacterium]